MILYTNKSPVTGTIIISIIGCVILFVIAALAGVTMYNEIMSIYLSNYQTLSDAGISDLVTAPKVVSDRVLWIMIMFPILWMGVFYSLVGSVAIKVYKITHPLE